MRTEKEIILDLCDNLRELRKRSQNAGEERDICISLLMSSILSQANEDITSAYEVYDRFTRSVPDADSSERLLACRSIIKQDALLTDELLNSMLTLTGDAAAGSHGKIAYVRNQYNDEAFSLFSDAVPNAKPVITSSFIETCEEILDNRCEFGIIPLENTADGKLFSFYSMLERYELKIVDLCLVETEDSTKSICYGLVSRGISKKTASAAVRKNKVCRFEFSVISEDAGFCSDIISALGECSARLLRISSIPVPYDDILQKFFFTVELTSAHLYELALYLCIEFSSYEFIGFYQNK